MPPDRRPLTIEETEQHLQTDNNGNLYWRGKRLRTTNWTRADRISLTSAIIAAVVAVVTLLANWTAIQALFA